MDAIPGRSLLAVVGHGVFETEHAGHGLATGDRHDPEVGMSSGTLLAIALSAVLVMGGVVAAIIFEARLAEPTVAARGVAQHPSDDHPAVPGTADAQGARTYTPLASG
jgi:hypothetical protein